MKKNFYFLNAAASLDFCHLMLNTSLADTNSANWHLNLKGQPWNWLGKRTNGEGTGEGNSRWWREGGQGAWRVGWDVEPGDPRTERDWSWGLAVRVQGFTVRETSQLNKRAVAANCCEPHTVMIFLRPWNSCSDFAGVRDHRPQAASKTGRGHR